MPGLPLTIRNLTARNIDVKLIERYQAPSSLEEKGEKFLGNLASNVTHFGRGSAEDPAPSAPHLKEGALSFARHEENIHIEKFSIKHTDIKASERSSEEVLRVTIECDGQRYRIDTPSRKNESQELVPLAHNPKLKLTGVFLPEHTFLAIYDSSDLHCWMKHLKDATPLSALSMPGTHNSPTHHRALPSVRCQAVSPREQLQNGVRLFDIRVQPDSPESAQLHLVHGVFPISLTGPKYFRDLLDDVLKFLSENPSETLVMSIKREGTGNVTDQQLGRILFDHYTRGNNAKHWYIDPHIPTLGQVRGKIVLLRRFAIGPVMQREHGERGWALDAECWADNTPCDTHGCVCVQDFYEVLETENIDKKIKFAEEHLHRASECICHLPGITTDKTHPVPPEPFYLNFLSASNFWKVGCWPEKIAKKLNPAIIDNLCRTHAKDTHGDGGTGIVVLDWVGAEGDWDIVRIIVGLNSKLIVREMSL
ncbi:MAG: hypothetical protein M1831_005898 [Alyxoria varia]|nr:MAG: hypothetical protein M1831_005898 [Alyxoria varia]